MVLGPTIWISASPLKSLVLGPTSSLSALSLPGKRMPPTISIAASPLKAVSMGATVSFDPLSLSDGIHGRQIVDRSLPTEQNALLSITNAELADAAGITSKFIDGSVTPVKLNKEYVESGEPTLLSTITGIDMTVVGTTNLLTLGASERAVILGVVLECSAAANVTNEAEAGVGVGAGEDDVFPSQPLTSLKTAGKIFRYISTSGVIVNALGVIKFGVDTAVTGTGPTQTVTAYLIGYKL